MAHVGKRCRPCYGRRTSSERKIGNQANPVLLTAALYDKGLSKFSSLSSRSNAYDLCALPKSFAYFARIRLRCLDAAAHARGLGVATTHVVIDPFSMSEAIGQHGIDVGETQCVVRLYDGFGSRAASESSHDNLQEHPGVADAIDARWFLSEGDGHGLNRRHARKTRKCHFRRSIAVAASIEDQVIKRDLYRSLGVREYCLFDPTNDYLRPPLQGLELAAGGLALASAMLGLELRVTERGLRFHDPHIGEDLPNYAETAQWRERQARLEAESLLAQETAARKAAEARVAELEARLRQAGGDDPAGGQPGSTCRAAGQWPLRSPGPWPGRASSAGGRSATGSFESATCWRRRR